MLKQIYRIIILIAIFIASLYYFSKDIRKLVFNIDNTTKMEEATFPLVRLRTECIINLLHGYASNLDTHTGITYTNRTGGSFEVLIQESDYEIKKLNYEVREFIGNELIEKGSVSVFDEENEFKTAKLHLSPDLQKERIMLLK